MRCVGQGRTGSWLVEESDREAKVWMEPTRDDADAEGYLGNYILVAPICKTGRQVNFQLFFFFPGWSPLAIPARSDSGQQLSPPRIAQAEMIFRLAGTEDPLGARLTGQQMSSCALYLPIGVLWVGDTATSTAPSTPLSGHKRGSACSARASGVLQWQTQSLFQR